MADLSRPFVTDGEAALAAVAELSVQVMRLAARVEALEQQNPEHVERAA